MFRCSVSGLEVRLKKAQITRIDEGAAGRREKIFDLADAKRITADQAGQLGGYYWLHRWMSRRNFQMLGAFPQPKTVTFDEKTARWTLIYEQGRREIAGWFAKIVLDANGGLVGFSEDVISR